MDDKDQPLPPVIGGVLDVERSLRILEGEMAAIEECRAGTRPWKYKPGEHPHYPEGLAGMTPGETEMLRRFNEACDRDLGPLRPELRRP